MKWCDEKGTYCVSGDCDETADGESDRVDADGQTPVEAGVIRRRNDVDARNVFVHRRQYQLQRGKEEK